MWEFIKSIIWGGSSKITEKELDKQISNHINGLMSDIPPWYDKSKLSDRKCLYDLYDCIQGLGMEDIDDVFGSKDFTIKPKGVLEHTYNSISIDSIDRSKLMSPTFRIKCAMSSNNWDRLICISDDKLILEKILELKVQQYFKWVEEQKQIAFMGTIKKQDERYSNGVIVKDPEEV